MLHREPHRHAMKISVITVCFNSARYIEKTMSSVLNQSFPDLEYVIVDGGSSDGTVEMIKARAALDARITWVSEPDRGISDAMNKGVRLASGEVIAHLHSDEFYLDGEVISEVAAAFRNNPGAVWLTGGSHFVDQEGRFLREIKVRRYSYRRLIHANIILHLATFIRRNVFLAAGGFDLTLHYCMDYHLWLRLGAIGDPVRIKRPLACFCVHSGSRTIAQAAASYAEVYRIRMAFLEARKLWQFPYRIEHLVTRQLNRLFMKRLNVSAGVGDTAEERPADRAPKISVVIPCYDHGAYLDEAVDSVLRQSCTDFEIVVVNDGSTDPRTVELLRSYDRPKTRVIHTVNQGLSSARNTGIRNATGRYILPLDADDRIAETYLEKAAAVLDARPEVGVVYCDQEMFGERQGLWSIPPYDPVAQLFDNLIFATAMYRKSDWAKVGGYSSKFIYGWEDWDFWISITSLKKEVVKLPEPLCFYRIRSGSMNLSMSTRHKMAMMALLILRHKRLYLQNIGSLARKSVEFIVRGFLSAAGLLQKPNRCRRSRDHLEQRSVKKP